MVFDIRKNMNFQKGRTGEKEAKIEKQDITWKIKDIDCYLGGEIVSPMFAAGNPCHSAYCIKLFLRFTKEGKPALSHKLVFLKGSYLRGYTYKISLVDDYGSTRQVPLFNPCKQNYQFVEQKFIRQSSLTLHCKLTFPKNHKDYTNDVTELSEKIHRLYESEEFSDLTLCTNDKNFRVHRFLLEIRARPLLEYLEVSKDADIVKVDKISTLVLNSLLQYVYSGKLSLPVGNLVEFFEMVEKCEFEEFKDTYRLSVPTTICNNIEVIHKKIFWNIDINHITPLFKLFHLDSNRVFLVEVSFTTTARRIAVHSSIQNVSKLEEPIFIKYTLSAACPTTQVLYYTEEKLWFISENKENELRLPIQNYEKAEFRDSKLQLVFDLSFSKGKNTCVIEDGNASCEVPSIFGMGLLSSDLDEMFDKVDHSFGDVKLSFKDGEINSNLAVLTASSPVFSEMFRHDMTENRTRVVNIPDFDLNTGKRLVRYMHSGKVTRDYYENDKNLYEAVDKYQVYNSHRKMSALMAGHLTEESNACDILVLADQRNNKSLFKTASLYISCHRSIILKSNSWISLIHTHPELVSKVLLEISGKLLI